MSLNMWTTMENVYVIKVKTKPALSSLYPSERRYSASTVGGLSLIHFGLGALSLLLGTLALSLQGPILFIACLVPFVTGLLAWRRWYIDRNITVFFYGNLFSMLAASLCFVVTISEITSGNHGRSLWPLAEILSSRHYSPLHPFNDTTSETVLDDQMVLHNENFFNVTDNHDPLKFAEFNKTPISFEHFSTEVNESAFIDGVSNNTYNGLKAEASFIVNQHTISTRIFQDENIMNTTQRHVDSMEETVNSFWRNRYQDSSHTRTLLSLNVLIASLLEIFWSLLSAKIAFCGMINRLPENNRDLTSSKAMKLPLQKRKPPAPKPDILDHRRLSESLRTLTNLHALTGPGPQLPLPESSREYRERVERFLAHQAIHRVDIARN